MLNVILGEKYIDSVPEIQLLCSFQISLSITGKVSHSLSPLPTFSLLKSGHPNLTLIIYLAAVQECLR